jgi:DNA-binding NarL/FixJ family response regulator
VGTHVEHVMAKLGCATRAACAARAAGEGLLREPAPGAAPPWMA